MVQRLFRNRSCNRSYAVALIALIAGALCGCGNQDPARGPGPIPPPPVNAAAYANTIPDPAARAQALANLNHMRTAATGQVPQPAKH